MAKAPAKTKAPAKATVKAVLAMDCGSKEKLSKLRKMGKYPEIIAMRVTSPRKLQIIADQEAK